MTTIGLIIFSVLAIIFFVIQMLAKKDETKMSASMLSFFLQGLMLMTIYILGEELSKAKEKQLNCPEYQKIENVYILKTKENEQP
jgi:hypothetical protein